MANKASFTWMLYLGIPFMVLAILAVSLFVRCNTKLTRKDIQDFCELKFPASAKDIKYTFYGGGENRIYVRFSMSPNELPQFWKETPCRAAETKTEQERQSLSEIVESREEQDRLLFPPPPWDKQEWWQPEKAVRFEIRTFPPPIIEFASQAEMEKYQAETERENRDKLIQKVVIDKTNDQQYLVYVFSLHTHRFRWKK